MSCDLSLWQRVMAVHLQFSPAAFVERASECTQSKRLRTCSNIFMGALAVHSFLCRIVSLVNFNARQSNHSLHGISTEWIGLQQTPTWNSLINFHIEWCVCLPNLASPFRLLEHLLLYDLLCYRRHISMCQVLVGSNQGQNYRQILVFRFFLFLASSIKAFRRSKLKCEGKMNPAGSRISEHCKCAHAYILRIWWL